MNSMLAQMQSKGLIFNAQSREQLACESNENASLETGFSSLDQLLNGGWPSSGVISIHSAPGVGELALLQNLFSKPSAIKDGSLVVFINPPADPCMQWLASMGLADDQVLLLRSEDHAQALWAAEQCSRSSSCASVWFWHQPLSFAQARRFNLATQQSQTSLVLLNYQQQKSQLPVQLSLSIAQQDNNALSVTLLRQQGRFARGQVSIDYIQLWPFLAYSSAFSHQHAHNYEITPVHEVG